MICGACAYGKNWCASNFFLMKTQNARGQQQIIFQARLFSGVNLRKTRNHSYKDYHTRLVAKPED